MAPFHFLNLFRTHSIVSLINTKSSVCSISLKTNFIAISVTSPKTIVTWVTTQMLRALLLQPQTPMTTQNQLHQLITPYRVIATVTNRCSILCLSSPTPTLYLVLHQKHFLDLQHTTFAMALYSFCNFSHSNAAWIVPF